MAKEPRATDSTAAPKKRTRKPTTEVETITKVTTAKNGSKPTVINEVAPATNLEEQIRIRAYQLYLERSGQGGSPKQDWFQAASEIYGESVA
jgi:hypothetical protein